MHPNPQHWDQFYSLMKRRTGLDLNKYKANQLQKRILSLMETKNCLTLDEFWKFLSDNQNHTTWFLDKLAINVSELYRNPEKWTELKEKILPKLIKQSRKLNCWSAGCSYGAEAYTLAIILDKHFPGSHTILGTDIDQAALAQAKEGRFSQEDMKEVPVAIRDHYFKKEGESWKAIDTLKKYFEFKTQNLLDDIYETNFDLIICRNVVIYFTEQTKEMLYHKFFASLKPGGVLFVGSTERVFNSKEIGFETAMPFIYRKPMQGEQIWRNAS